MSGPESPLSSLRAAATAEKLAEQFHDEYEALAPAYGYETREETRTSWDDLPSALKRLMVAVVNTVVEPVIDTALTALEATEERYEQTKDSLFEQFRNREAESEKLLTERDASIQRAEAADDARQSLGDAYKVVLKRAEAAEQDRDEWKSTVEAWEAGLRPTEDLERAEKARVAAEQEVARLRGYVKSDRAERDAALGRTKQLEAMLETMYAAHRGVVERVNQLTEALRRARICLNTVLVEGVNPTYVVDVVDALDRAALDSDSTEGK